MSVMFPASQPVHLDYANAVDITDELKLAPKTLAQDCYVYAYLFGFDNGQGLWSSLTIDNIKIAEAYQWKGSYRDRIQAPCLVPASKGDTISLVGPENIESYSTVMLIPYK